MQLSESEKLRLKELDPWLARLKPINDLVILSKITLEQKNLIILKEGAATEDSYLATVVASGPKCSVGFIPGQTVVYKFGFEEMFVDGHTFLVGKESAVLAVLSSV